MLKTPVTTLLERRKGSVVSVIAHTRAGFKPITGPPRVVALGHDEPDDLCHCVTQTLTSVRGDIIVLHVVGEVDLSTLPVLQAALAASIDRRPRCLVVDLSRLTYCGGGGMRQLVQAGHSAAGNDIEYAVCGCTPQLSRIWSLVWTAADIPVRHSNVAAAVTAFTVGQTVGNPR